MKVAVTSKGGSLSSEIDERFGRARFFVVADTETGDFEAHENPAAVNAHGAGVAAAKFLADRGVEALISGNVGPKAFMTLNAAGIKIYSASSMTVAEAIEALKQGKLDSVSEPTRPGGHNI